jgi:hypothetical protein
MRRRFSAVISDIGLMEIAIGVALALALVDLAQAIGQTFVYWWQTPASTIERTGGEDVGTALALENLSQPEDSISVGACSTSRTSLVHSSKCSLSSASHSGFGRGRPGERRLYALGSCALSCETCACVLAPVLTPPRPRAKNPCTR